ncbi:DUF2947 domain-containing protein [Inconstantimicrobium mannanitabidum]|uniref:Uncharacterized protein n=1 Tax=Inconstantimicrobium mannanitabidum TaxID=1604901 RepID=A0ACB5RHS8_9CLOT|nr:DUF2947 domain-containing protein [Clostridium sp. TW13]GKX68629.1 hypothetical protein rsdtw13_38870 [Clostridium sp. TW13]
MASNQNKYISMEELQNKWFFYVEDMKIPDEDINTIRPLSKEYSSLIWNENISSLKHHFALFREEEKQLLQLEKVDYDWQEDWNNDQYDNLKEYLSKNIPYITSDKIIVFWQKQSSVETGWEIFLKHWPNFLFEDEGVVLMNKTNDNILLFTSDGRLQMGKRLLRSNIL